MNFWVRKSGFLDASFNLRPTTVWGPSLWYFYFLIDWPLRRGWLRALTHPSINLVTPTWTLFTWEEWKCSKVASKAGVLIAFTTVVYYLTGQVCLSVTKHIWTNIFLHTKWERRRQLLEDLNQAWEGHNKWRVVILCFILVAPSDGFLRKGLSFIPSYWSWAAIVSRAHLWWCLYTT